MIEIRSLADLTLLCESVDLECKLAAGRDGQGALPDDFWPTYLKLTADLKVPFTLEKGERKDETPVHVALREALANVLVHADYSDRASVLVVKRPDTPSADSLSYTLSGDCVYALCGFEQHASAIHFGGSDKLEAIIDEFIGSRSIFAVIAVFHEQDPRFLQLGNRLGMTFNRHS